MSVKSPGSGGAIVQGAGGSIKQAFTDNSGTPGSTTINTPRGRFAFAGASTAVTVTCSAVSATSSIMLQLGGTDTTMFAVRATAGAGSFVATGNASSTGVVPCDFVVFN